MQELFLFFYNFPQTVLALRGSYLCSKQLGLWAAFWTPLSVAGRRLYTYEPLLDCTPMDSY